MNQVIKTELLDNPQKILSDTTRVQKELMGEIRPNVKVHFPYLGYK